MKTTEKSISKELKNLYNNGYFQNELDVVLNKMKGMEYNSRILHNIYWLNQTMYFNTEMDNLLIQL